MVLKKEKESAKKATKKITSKVAKVAKKAESKPIKKDKKIVEKKVKKEKKEKKTDRMAKRFNKLRINSNEQTQRGVLYIGHLPKGFNEEELKKFFGQFGTVSKIRLARSKTSGRSKGYGFL